MEITLKTVKCRIKNGNDLLEPFMMDKGLKQGDGLSCLLFNIALEKIIRDAKLETKGTIYSKSIQILAYADDVDIVGRTINSIKEAFLALSKAASNMGLTINKEKTKFLGSLGAIYKRKVLSG